MPFYDHECQECKHIWEDFYSARKDPPDTCPQCGVVGKVMRLIPNNICVRVPLTGQDLKNQIKQDAEKMRHQMATDEKFAANFEGESVYENKINAKKTLEDNLKQL
jgi:putative FmdB family regulatory protein